jgi:hypothetical protein
VYASTLRVGAAYNLGETIRAFPSLETSGNPVWWTSQVRDVTPSAMTTKNSLAPSHKNSRIGDYE